MTRPGVVSTWGTYGMIVYQVLQSVLVPAIGLQPVMAGPTRAQELVDGPPDWAHELWGRLGG